MANEELKQRYQQADAEDLYKVVANEGDYRENALSVVRAELATRGLPTEAASLRAKLDSAPKDLPAPAPTKTRLKRTWMTYVMIVFSTLPWIIHFGVKAVANPLTFGPVIAIFFMNRWGAYIATAFSLVLGVLVLFSSRFQNDRIELSAVCFLSAIVLIVLWRMSVKRTGT